MQPVIHTCEHVANDRESYRFRYLLPCRVEDTSIGAWKTRTVLPRATHTGDKRGSSGLRCTDSRKNPELRWFQKSYMMLQRLRVHNPEATRKRELSLHGIIKQRLRQLQRVRHSLPHIPEVQTSCSPDCLPSRREMRIRSRLHGVAYTESPTRSTVCPPRKRSLTDRVTATRRCPSSRVSLSRYSLLEPVLVLV